MHQIVVAFVFRGQLYRNIGRVDDQIVACRIAEDAVIDHPQPEHVIPQELYPECAPVALEFDRVLFPAKTGDVP
ncbi:hypothetical protein [Microbacter margulisiae]|uniref:Uncharacterized protein n=1 Tax=Microbacter margulisiae TaxID=1350067 RepID=A0A7W5DTC6_9PORP|nr:hypothetical protein [Microbacter margulisiae]